MSIILAKKYENCSNIIQQRKSESFFSLFILLIPFGLCFVEIFFQQAHVKVHEFQTDQSHKKAFTFVVKSSIFVENGSFNSLLCLYTVIILEGATDCREKIKNGKIRTEVRLQLLSYHLTYSRTQKPPKKRYTHLPQYDIK